MGKKDNRHEKKRNMKALLSTMFKIGCIGFGGGTALVPVIESEVVYEKKLVDKEEYTKDVIVANITPGALPVEVAAGVGRKVCGMPGMLLSALLMGLPGTFLTVLLLILINSSGIRVLQQILFASAGVTAYIIYMLIMYAKGTWRECRESGTAKSGMFFMFLVFFLTSGKELLQLFGIDRTPIFDISTIDVLCAAFFIIFYTGGVFRWGRVIVSVIITVLYCLCVGKMHLISSTMVLGMIRLAMVVLSIYGLRTGIEGKIPFSWKSLKRLIREEICWAAMFFLLSLPALICFGKTLAFAGRGLISAVISFGGGDAYLAVANGMFVNTGMVGYDDFYFKIASVANGLPGSILCKILAGVGYILGCQSGGVWCGIFVALCGFACSIAASGGTFSAVVYIYERFENLQIFHVLQTYMRPIVAGLLLTVCTSMIYQNMSIACWYFWPLVSMLLLTFGIFLLNIFWRRRGVVRPLQMVLFSAAASLIVCNVFASIP